MIKIHTLAAVFLQTEPISILNQSIESLRFDLVQYNTMDAVLHSFVEASKQNDTSDIRTYVYKAYELLQGDGKTETNTLNPSLENILSILAEAYLSVTAYVIQGRKDIALKNLNSALLKCQSAVNYNRFRFEYTHEAETIMINGNPRAVVEWEYQGNRPQMGSIVRLAQDIDFAIHTLQLGQLPDMYHFFRKWDKTIPSS